MNFASDNVHGAHPAILEALAAANSGPAAPYGNDTHTAAAERRLGEIFGREVKAFLVTTGTAANGLALSAICPGHGAILCHGESHIHSDECNGPAFFTGGGRAVGIAAPGGKLTPALVETALKGFFRGNHDPALSALSITNVSEIGTVYSAAETQALAALAHGRGMKFHLDGARFANAVAATGASAADLSWKAGVDVMSFGASKNGTLMAEAVVFFDMALAADFSRRRLRAGQTMAKGRYLGAQINAYLDGDLWLANARHANRLARRLADGLSRHSAIRIPYPVEANIIFAAMPEKLVADILAAGAFFHRRPAAGVGGGAGETSVRLVTSFVTTEGEIDTLLALVAERAGR